MAVSGPSAGWASDDGAVRVLVVDDEPALRSSLERALRQAGYDVGLAADGREALRAVAAEPPDAVVLDVVMPGIDGIEATRRLRADGNRTPVLLLTARQEVADRVSGLDAGADDYLTKPFALDELLARLRALLRRSAPGEDDRLSFADLALDPASRQVTRGGRPVELTRTEFALLELFLRNPGRVLSRSAIYEEVWGYDFGSSSNSLDVYLGYLRRKTEEGGEARLLHTVRGVGVVLRQP
jgi:two-component system response regulator MprA